MAGNLGLRLMKKHWTSFRLTGSSTYTPGCHGIIGGHGAPYGAGGGAATIRSITIVAHGGGIAVTGTLGESFCIS